MIRKTVWMMLHILVLTGMLSAHQQKSGLIPREYHFAAWSLAIGAVPYAGHGAMVLVSGAGMVSTARKPGPAVLKLAMYPFLAAVMGINGYALYLCTQDNDNYVPAMLMGSLGSGLTLAAGTWVNTRLAKKYNIADTHLPSRWALYPSFGRSGYGLTLSRSL